MIGIAYIRFFDSLHVRADIVRQSRRFREPLNDGSPHLLPQQLYAVHIGRCVAQWEDEGRSIREGISFTRVVTCGRHRLPDLIRDSVASAVAEGSRQSSGNGAATAFQKLGEQAGSVADHRQRRAYVSRMMREILGRALNQGGFE